MKNKCFIAVCLLLFIVSLITGCGSGRTYTSGTENVDKEEELNTEPDILEGNGLTVAVDFGYEKFVKDGRCAKVFVTIKNVGKDFSGDIYMGFPSGKMQTIAYKKGFSVASMETEKLEMAVPMNYGSEEINFSIKDDKDTTVLSKKIKVNVAYNANLVYVGVLTNDISRFSSFTGSNIKLFFLSKEEFPENVLCLDSLDAILLDDFDTTILNEKQRNALQEFSKEASLISTEKDWNIEKQLEEKLLDNLSKSSKNRMEKEAYGYKGYSTAYSATKIKGSNKIPCVLPYAIAIICYLILVGPPLYFILKKMDKPGALWIMVPILSVIFALTIYAMGKKTRLTNPYIGYLTILDIGQDKTKEQVMFSLTSPYNTGYEVSIPKEYQVTAVDSDLGYTNNYFNNGFNGNFNDEYNTTIDWTKEDTRINVTDNAAFSNGYYKAERKLEGGDKLDGEIHMSVDYKVTGTVTNTTGYNLTNACLSVGDVYVILGDVKDGETVTLDDKKQENMSSSIELYQGKLVEDLAGGNPNIESVEERTSQIYYAYQYYLDDRMSSFIREVCELVGFAKQEVGSEIFRDVSYHKDGILMVKTLGGVNYASEGTVFIPNIDIYMHAEDTYYYDTYRYMNSDTMKFKIQFNKNDKIRQLIYSKTLNNEFKKDSWNGFYGTIKAYNYMTEKYDVLFSGGEEKTVIDVSPYINKDNSMSILMEANAQKANNKSITIPVLSAVKEAN